MTSHYQSEVDLFIGLYPKRTQTTYLDCIKRLIRFMDANGLEFHHMSLEQLERFKSYIEVMFAPKTCNMTMNCIKQLFTFLESRGVLTVNQTGLIKPTKLSSREQKTSYLTESEVKRMLQVVYAMPDMHARNSNKIMLLIMINAGLRKDELANLKPKDIVTINGKTVLKVVGKGMRHRMISLSAPVANEVRSAIAELGIENDKFVITGYSSNNNSNTDKPMNPDSLLERVKSLAKKANIRKEITPHSLRRTCATLLYGKDVPIEVIQRILGHENVTTTQRYIAMEVDIEMSSKHALELA